jgi:raffinose/stachyose/melibiose transport system permease protein
MKHVLGDKRAIAILLGPALLVYTLVMLVPVIWSLGYTVFEGNAITGFTFVGVDNFVRAAGDPKVWDAVLFTVRYLMSLLYVFVLKRSSGIIRTLVFFPVVLPTVAVALLFQKMFEVAPSTGVVNTVITSFGGESVDWFGSGANAFLVIAIMDIWRSIGFYGVLLYAGIVEIPEDTLESARLDGATGWSLVRHIVIPLSLPVLLSAIIFSVNGTLKVFDSIIALTNGGPGNATSPLTLYMFQTSFSYGEYGYGSTIALLLTIICLVVTVFIFRSSRRDLTKA